MDRKDKEVVRPRETGTPRENDDQTKNPNPTPNQEGAGQGAVQ